MDVVQGMALICPGCKAFRLVDPSMLDAPVRDPDVPCPLRGPWLREVECELCGLRGVMVEVRACPIFGECTVGARGIKDVSGVRVAVCVGCESNPLSKSRS